MLTAAGSGYSRWQDLAVTRWREDATRDCWGNYIFLRDSQTGFVWSAGYQPTCVEPESYEVSFFEDRAEFIRRDGSLTTKLEVVVSPEDDAEVRRVTITNLGTRAREIQVRPTPSFALRRKRRTWPTLHFQIYLWKQNLLQMAPPCRHATQAVRQRNGSLGCACGRGGRRGCWRSAIRNGSLRFLGRCHDARKPVSIFDGRPLSNTVGSVLDPILSLRRTVRIPAGTTVRIIFSTHRRVRARSRARSRR